MHGSRDEEQKPVPIRLTQEQIDQCEASATEEASLDAAVSTLTKAQAESCKTAASKEYWKRGHHKATNPNKKRKQEADEAALVLKKKQELAKELGLVGKLNVSAYDQKAQILAGKKKTAMLLDLWRKPKAKQTSASPGEIRNRKIQSLADRNVTKMLQKVEREWAGRYVKQDDLWMQVLLIPGEPNPGSGPRCHNKNPEEDADLERAFSESAQPAADVSDKAKTNVILDNIADSDAEVDWLSDVSDSEVETSEDADANDTLEPAKSSAKRKNPFEDEPEDCAKIKRFKTANVHEECTSVGLVATSAQQSPQEPDSIIQPEVSKPAQMVHFGVLPKDRTLLTDVMGRLGRPGRPGRPVDCSAVDAELEEDSEDRLEL